MIKNSSLDDIKNFRNNISKKNNMTEEEGQKKWGVGK
jgi:hypothetical protein